MSFGCIFQGNLNFLFGPSCDGHQKDIDDILFSHWGLHVASVTGVVTTSHLDGGGVACEATLTWGATNIAMDRQVSPSVGNVINAMLNIVGPVRASYTLRPTSSGQYYLEIDTNSFRRQ